MFNVWFIAIVSCLSFSLSYFILYFGYRRDSFITHRAFCDALAQESARHPTSLSTLGSHLFGPSSALGGANNGANNNMGLGVGLSHQVANHLPPSLSDQMTSDILRLGGGARGVGSSQFDHLLGPGSFRQQHNIQQNQANFYLSDQTGGSNHFANSNNNDQENQSQNAGGGIFSNKLFTGQLPVPDLGFFSNNNNNENTNTINTNTNAGSGDHNVLFSPTGSGSLFGGPPSGGLSSLYTTGPALQGSPHMSATALLQKAAQMGSTTSTSNASATALLKGLEAKQTPQQQSAPPQPPTSVGGGGFGGLFGENDQNNLHDLLMRDNLMSSPFFGGGDHHHHQTGGTGDHNNNNYGGFNPNKTGLGVGSSDRLTRDFLGVGEIVRSMSGSGGGFPPNSQSMASLDLPADHQRNNSAAAAAATNSNNVNNSAPSSSQAFGGGNTF